MTLPDAPSRSEESSALRAFYERSRICMGVVELTDDGDILHLYDNPATERFFGLAPGSSAGRLARAELRVDDAVIDIWRSHYLRSQAQGAPVQFEYRYDDANQGKVVGGLMQYVVSPEGQEAAAKAAGSAPISDKLRAQLEPAAAAVGGGGQ